VHLRALTLYEVHFPNVNSTGLAEQQLKRLGRPHAGTKHGNQQPLGTVVPLTQNNNPFLQDNKASRLGTAMTLPAALRPLTCRPCQLSNGSQSCTAHRRLQQLRHDAIEDLQGAEQLCSGRRTAVLRALPADHHGGGCTAQPVASPEPAAGLLA